MTPSCRLLHPWPSLLFCGTMTQPSALYYAEAHGHGEGALCKVWSLCLDASSLASVTWILCCKEIHSNFRHVPPAVIVVSNLHMPDLDSVSQGPSKSGGVVSDSLPLSCFSCLNSSADSPPTCFCSAGYTGNGTHCTGMSSKCGQDSRLANTCWSYAKTRVLFVK